MPPKEKTFNEKDALLYHQAIMNELQKKTLTAENKQTFEEVCDNESTRKLLYDEYPRLKAIYDKAKARLNETTTEVKSHHTAECETIFKELYGDNPDARFEKTEEGFNLTLPKEEDPMKFLNAMAEKKIDFKAINLETGEFIAGAVDGKMYKDEQTYNKAYEAKESTVEVQEQPGEERGIGGPTR